MHAPRISWERRTASARKSRLHIPRWEVTSRAPGWHCRKNFRFDLYQSRTEIMLSALLLFASLVARTTNAAFYYPDVQTHLLEHTLVDNWGAYASNFSSAITPCTRYVTQTGDTALKSGRTTAAQWMRSDLLLGRRSCCT